LDEWAEPDDAQADLDPGHKLQHAAMRNVRLWKLVIEGPSGPRSILKVDQ
jgi:hypothetical protein